MKIPSHVNMLLNEIKQLKESARIEAKKLESANAEIEGLKGLLTEAHEHVYDDDVLDDNIYNALNNNRTGVKKQWALITN